MADDDEEATNLVNNLDDQIQQICTRYLANIFTKKVKVDEKKYVYTKAVQLTARYIICNETPFEVHISQKVFPAEDDVVDLSV